MIVRSSVVRAEVLISSILGCVVQIYGLSQINLRPSQGIRWSDPTRTNQTIIRSFTMQNRMIDDLQINGYPELVINEIRHLPYIVKENYVRTIY